VGFEMLNQGIEVLLEEGPSGLARALVAELMAQRDETSLTRSAGSSASASACSLRLSVTDEIAEQAVALGRSLVSPSRRRTASKKA
jgi:hypothetical protein